MRQISRKTYALLAASCGLCVLAVGLPRADAQVTPITYNGGSADIYNNGQSDAVVTGIDPLNPTDQYIPNQIGNGVDGPIVPPPPATGGTPQNNQYYNQTLFFGPGATQANVNANAFFQFNVVFPPNNGTTDPSYIPNGPLNITLQFQGDIKTEAVATVPVPTNAPNTAITINIPLAPVQPLGVQTVGGGYFLGYLINAYGYNGAYGSTAGFPETGSVTPVGGPADGLTYYLGDLQFNQSLVRKANGAGLVYATSVDTGNASIQSASTWASGAVPSIPGDIANFTSATSNATITLDAPVAIGSLNLNDSNSYTIAPGTGGTLTIEGFEDSPGSVTASLGDHFITAPVTLAANTSFTVNNGTTLTVSGNIGGPGSLSTSAGFLLLSGNNSYQGGTTVTGGTLMIGNPNALGTGALAANGGTVDLNGNSLSVPGISGGGVIDNVSAGGTVTLTDTGSGSTFFNGQINNTSGTVNLVMNGGAGSVFILAGANGYTGSTTVSSGTLITQNAAALPVGGAVTNNASLSVQAGSSGNPSILGAITGTGSTDINATGYLQIAPGSGNSTQSLLTIEAGGTLDLTTNEVVLNYGSLANDPVAAIAADILSGNNGGNWTGTGITSSSITSPKFAVGYADSDSGDLATGIQANQLIIRYTLAGDANLAGSVGISDLLVVAQNFGKTGKDWAHGNFTYSASGAVGIADLLLVAQNFGKTVGTSVSGSVGTTVSPAFDIATSSVPEPTSLTLAAVAAGGLLARRRSSKKA